MNWRLLPMSLAAMMAAACTEQQLVEPARIAIRGPRRDLVPPIITATANTGSGLVTSYEFNSPSAPKVNSSGDVVANVFYPDFSVGIARTRGSVFEILNAVSGWVNNPSSYGMDDDGTVVLAGFEQVDTQGGPVALSRAMRWLPNGSLQNLGDPSPCSPGQVFVSPSGARSSAVARSGDIAAAGAWRFSGQDLSHLLRWKNGTGWQVLGTPPVQGPFGQNVYATAISSDGSAIGFTVATGLYTNEVGRWTEANGMEILGLPRGDDGNYSVGVSDINNQGWFVGRRYNAVYLWTPADGFILIGGGNEPFINNVGQVAWAGTSSEHPKFAGQIVLRDADGTVNIPEYFTRLNGEKWSLGSNWNAEVWDLNNNGVIVGRITTFLGQYITFSFQYSGGDAVEELPSFDGFEPLRATGINDVGVIAGTVWRGQNPQRVVRWFPAAPPPPLNSPPAVSLGSSYSGSEGSALSFGFNSSDPDNDALTYRWDLGDGSTGTGSALPSSHVYVDNGSYTVSVTADDGKGGTDTKTVGVTIANLAPSVQLTLARSVIVSGETAELSANISDPGSNDAPWGYTATWASGSVSLGFLSSLASPLGLSQRYCLTGNYSVSLRVSDKDGASATATKSLFVARLRQSGSSKGTIALTSGKAAQIPVTIFSAPGFDATQLLPITMTLGNGAGLEATPIQKKQGGYQVDLTDVNIDGRPDMTVYFDRDRLVSNGDLSTSTTNLIFRGLMSDNCTNVESSIAVRVSK